MENNYYTIRPVITDDEKQDVINLWMSSHKLMREPLKDYALKPSFHLGTIIGAYKNNQLCGTLKYIKWDRMPCYSIGMLFIKENLIPLYKFNNSKNPIIYITDYILDHMESQNFFNWYYVRAISKGYAKIQESGQDLLSNTKLGYRYRRDIEEIVMPGERSKFEVHDDLLLNRTWKLPMLVVKCCLENQYRPNGLIFKEEKNFIFCNVKTNTTTS